MKTNAFLIAGGISCDPFLIVPRNSTMTAETSLIRLINNTVLFCSALCQPDVTLDGFDDIASLDGITLGIDWKYFKVLIDSPAFIHC